LDHDIEDGDEFTEEGFLAEDGEEAGEIPAIGDVLFVFDTDEEPQGGVAAEFVEAGGHGGVAEKDGEEEATPEDADGELVAAVVTALGEGVEQRSVGDGDEEIADALE